MFNYFNSVKDHLNPAVSLPSLQPCVKFIYSIIYHIIFIFILFHVFQNNCSSTIYYSPDLPVVREIMKLMGESNSPPLIIDKDITATNLGNHFIICYNFKNYIFKFCVHLFTLLRRVL